VEIEEEDEERAKKNGEKDTSNLIEKGRPGLER